MEDKVNYVRIDIIEQETEEIVDTIYPARALDFWGICWEQDSYNLWTQSSDIGIYCYSPVEGSWKCDYDAVMPDYFITRYQLKSQQK